ncbi:DUF6417 family protein [Streptomyces sp. NPDC049915]|uniref:DUF6417 family protein n=1 Tax=Streptomyces sp. NPDC049915 TaxID=3155510 RepID=UPI003439023E
MGRSPQRAGSRRLDLPARCSRPHPARHTTHSFRAGDRAAARANGRPARLREPCPVLRVPPADGLVERVRTAYFDRPGSRWRMTLTVEQIDSVAYAFHLRALSGSVAEANWFVREYGVTHRADPSTGRPVAVRSPGPAASG